MKGDTGMSDPLSAADEHKRVRGQQGGHRLSKKHPLSSSDRKHIDVRYHILRELVSSGDISVQYLRSEDPNGGILTKQIGREGLKRYRAIPFREGIIFQ